MLRKDLLEIKNVLVEARKSTSFVAKLWKLLLLLSLTTISKAEDFAQCPFGDKRAFNYNNVSCVWCSLENLGTYNREPKLYNLSKNPRYQHPSGPGEVAQVLKNFGIKFKQTTDKEEGRKLIYEAMRDGRGCLVGVPGHAINLINYDDTTNKAIIVDNGGSLKNRLMSIQEFERRWTGWVLVIYTEGYDEYIRPWIPKRKLNLWYYQP